MIEETFAITEATMALTVTPVPAQHEKGWWTAAQTLVPAVHLCGSVKAGMTYSVSECWQLRRIDEDDAAEMQRPVGRDADGFFYWRAIDCTHGDHTQRGVRNARSGRPAGDAGREKVKTAVAAALLRFQQQHPGWQAISARLAAIEEFRTAFQWAQHVQSQWEHADSSADQIRVKHELSDAEIAFATTNADLV